jgi:hypothetical protein
VLICVVVELIPILIFWMTVVCINVRHDLAFGTLVRIGTIEVKAGFKDLAMFALWCYARFHVWLV